MRKYYIFIFLMLILLVSSCGKADSDMSEGVANAVAFDYFITYEINETEYDVYLPSDMDDAIYYTHELGDIKSTSSEWIVNFMYEPTYQVEEKSESKEVWSMLYRKLLECEDILEEKCNFDVKLFDPYDSVELEYVLNNKNNVEATYVIFYTYLPVRMFNKATRKTITIGMPIDVSVLLKIGDMVENPFDGNMLDWSDFLAI